MMTEKNVGLMITRGFIGVLVSVLLVCTGLDRLAEAQNVAPIDAAETIDVLDLKNMDVLDVLKLIAKKSGLNIVAGQNVKGRVTVFLRDIDVLDALSVIVDAYGWAYKREGDMVKVMMADEFQRKYGHPFGQDRTTSIRPLAHANAVHVQTTLAQLASESGKIIADQKSNLLIMMDTPAKIKEMESILQQIDVNTSTEIFKLSYADAEDVSNKIMENLTPDVGTLKFDGRSNKIVVSDMPHKLREIANIIKAFDQKDREVLIEAKILQIILGESHKFGVNWEAVVRQYHDLNLKSTFDILPPISKGGSLSIGTIDNDDYTVLVEALDTVGDTNILSSPSITTLNNMEAKILVGSQQPYVTSSVTTPASGPTTTAEQIQFIEVGVKLYVTPTIHDDDFITMKIKPEVSSVVDTITTGSNNSIPVVETSEAETTVMVKDDVTIVIGGLIREETINGVKKVPYLGDIPYVGLAFKSISESLQKSEIVIFLTPRIISGDIDRYAQVDEAQR